MASADDLGLPEDISLREACSVLDYETARSDASAAALAKQSKPHLPPATQKPRVRKRTHLIPIILVDRSALFRAGLRQILNGSQFQVTADCNGIDDVPPGAFGEGKSAAIIGLGQDVPAILHCIRALKSQHPELRIVMLQGRMDADQVVTAIGSGVDSYLLRDEVKPETILRSLEMVLADGIVVPQGFAKLMNPATGPKSNGASGNELIHPVIPVQKGMESVPLEAGVTALGSDLARLSERERLILSYLTLGASNKLIARKLDVAEATVKAHVKSLLRKLRVNNRTQAAMWAISRGGSGDIVS